MNPSQTTQQFSTAIINIFCRVDHCLHLMILWPRPGQGKEWKLGWQNKLSNSETGVKLWTEALHHLHHLMILCLGKSEAQNCETFISCHHPHHLGHHSDHHPETFSICRQRSGNTIKRWNSKSVGGGEHKSSWWCLSNLHLRNHHHRQRQNHHQHLHQYHYHQTGRSNGVHIIRMKLSDFCTIGEAFF